MTDITTGERYTELRPWTKGLEPDTGQAFLCFDQQKTNLFWLVEPRIDAEGIEAARKNPIAEAIDHFMDSATREHLRKLPLDFMAYWSSIDNGDLAMTQDWPPGYLKTMATRANEAQRRLLGIVEEGNVVRVQFRRKA